MITFLVTALALQGIPADSPAGEADSASVATAYLDAGARSLVAGARARRGVVDRSVGSYEAMARERLTVGARSGWLERMVYRRETVARVSWVRGAPARIEFLGAREVAPVAVGKAAVPGDLDGDLMDELMAGLAFDPGEQAQLLSWGDSAFIRHPLAPGSERYYRFRSGDTTVVRLPDGGTVRVIELEVLPRRASVRTIRGSFLVDAATHAVVRMAFRLSRDVSTGAWGVHAWERTGPDSTGAVVTDTSVSIGFGAKELTGEDVEDPDSEFADSSSDPLVRKIGAPLRLRLLAALMPDVEASLRFITVDYGLWDGEWWLPRLVALEGVVRLPWATVPLRYERRYDDYRVGGEPAPGEVAARWAAAQRIEGGDSVVVVVPGDTASLLVSELLPHSIFSTDPWLLRPAEREAILGGLADLGAGAGAVGVGEPWDLSPRLDFDPLARYNRVEGLSVGVGVAADLGPVEVEAAGRFGLADREPRGALSLVRESPGARWEVTGYRALRTMDPDARAHTWVSSASALLFGYDESDYHDALGLALTGAPPTAAPQTYRWRLYVQREDSVVTGADFSLPRLFDDAERFRPNPAAAPAVQYGAELALRRWWGRDPEGFRFGGELLARGALGDFAHGGPEVTLRGTFPLPGPFVGALETGTGAVWGEPAFQHLRRVGGTGSLRGYIGSAMVGESSWRVRGALATRFPAARVALFTDAAWAGDRADFLRGRPLRSVGLGFSFLDGYLRADIARALDAPTGWRLALYLDAPL